MATEKLRLPWESFDAPEPVRPRRDPGWCNPGEATNPGTSCTVHKVHHYCSTCSGWYGAPHDTIHTEGPVRAAHPLGANPIEGCVCRPCRTYRAMSQEERHAAFLAYDTAKAQEGQQS